MKSVKFLCLALSALMLLTFSGCAKEKHYSPADYVTELDISGHEDYKILQLTDIHVANKDDRARQYRFLEKLVKKADPDMIVVTGDLFTFADRKVLRELIDTLDSFGLPWTLTFGNHDEQCYFSVDTMTSYLNRYQGNLIFRDLQDDDVTGSANFAINLKKDGELFEQLILMDSNRYCFGEYIGYDYIKDDQIAWYDALVDDTAEKNNGTAADSILFFHIPLPEWDTAWDGYENGSPDVEYIWGVKNEKTCCPDYNSGFFDHILEKDSTKLIAVGHDHLNNFILKYKGVYLAYGVNTTDRIYFTEELLGGRMITIHDDHSLSFEDVLMDYDDYE